MTLVAPSLWEYLDPSGDAVIVVDSRGVITRANARAEAMFGRSRVELVGQPIEVLVPARLHARHGEHVARYAGAPEFRPMCQKIDVRGVRADGAEFPVEISLLPLNTPDGLQIVATIREPRPLAESEQRLAAFLELGPDPMIAVDEAGTIRLGNTAAERLFGRPRAALVGLDVSALVPEPARSRHGDHLRAFFSGSRTRPMGEGLELTALAGDGREVPVEISLAPTEVGGRRMVVAAIRDVSDRRRAQHELRAAHDRMEAVFAVAKLGAWELDIARDHRTYSKGTLALLGAEKAGASGGSLLSNVHPDDREAVGAALERAKSDGEPRVFEGRMEHGERPIWFRASVRPERGPSGVVEKLWGLVQDVTEEREASVALAETNARLEAFLSSAPDFVVYCDLDGTIRFINRAVAPLTKEQIVGAPWLSFLPPTEREIGAAAFDRALVSPLPVEVEVQALVPPGAWFSCHIGRVMREGEPGGVVIVARDVTARKLADAQLAATEQLASLGMMSGALAHELNNPLAAALWGFDFALGDQDATPGVLDVVQRDALNDARHALKALQGIVHDLKLFARAESSTTQSIDVNAVLASTLRLARNKLRHRARVVTEFGEVPRVVGAEGRLGQVFLNLLVNAAQAIPEGDSDRNEIRVSTRLDEDGRVRIDIRDTGIGMSAEVRARLFTPFFTTKPAGLGTGLGLSICQRILESFGGAIAAQSTPGHGSTFSVLLPPGGRSSAEPAAPTPRPASRARLLILDDDRAIVRALLRALRAHHDAVGVSTAVEAYAHLEGAVPTDVIVCDLMMPATTGAEFFEEVVRRRPECRDRFVFLTGGAFTEGARAFLASLSAPVLQKPIELAQLLAAIEARRSTSG